MFLIFIIVNHYACCGSLGSEKHMVNAIFFISRKNVFTIYFLTESYKTLNIENLGICEKGHKMKSNTNKMKAFFVLDKK